MKPQRNYIILLVIVLFKISCFGQSNKKEVNLSVLLEKKEWFTNKLFLSDIATKKYELTAIESKQEYKDSIGANILGFYKHNTLFSSYKNLPRCGNDPSEYDNFYGTYKILDKNNIKVEIGKPVGNTVILKENVFVPAKTKKSTFYFKIIKKETKLYLIKKGTP